ncbi:MAG TPA: RHS repeat-associated core domain-containing protein [Cytophagaceae bacterium]|nr:RHS repeat-associated core domain-containing protein [Cytophagaceae bacterium]
MKNIFRYTYWYLLFILCTPTILNAQSNWKWTNTYGGVGADQELYAFTDANGNNYHSGSFTGSVTISGTTLTAVGGASDIDILIVKYDKNGVFQWAKSVGGTGTDYGRGLGVDINGNVYVCGFYNSTSITFNGTTVTNTGLPYRDILVLKFSSSGAPQWIKSFGQYTDDSASGLVVDYASGDCYINGPFSNSITFGTTTLTSHGQQDIYVLKLNTSGAVQWARGGGSSGPDTGYDFALDGSGYLYSIGYVSGSASFNSVTSNAFGGWDVSVVKYNVSTGIESWAISAGSTGNDAGFGIGISPTGHINITGYFQGTASFGTSGTVTSKGGNDMFVAQYNTSGILQWVQSAGGTLDDNGFDLTVDADNNIYVAGTFNSTMIITGLPVMTSAGGSDAFMVKYADAGFAAFSAKAGGTNNDSGNGVGTDATNKVFFSGSFQGTASIGGVNKTSAGNYDSFVTLFTNLDYTWTGATNTAWNTPTNWSPYGVPTGADNITIVNATNQPTSSGSVIARKFTMSSGTINLSGGSLYITDSSFFNNGNINGTVFSFAAIASFSAVTFSSSVFVTCANIYLNGATFNGAVSINKTGSAQNISSGGNTFKLGGGITNSGAGEMRLSGTTGDTFGSSIAFIRTGSGSLNVAYNGDSYFRGDIQAFSVPMFGAGNGVIHMDGAQDQSIGSELTTIPRLVVNKFSNVNFTNYDIPVTISNYVIFSPNTNSRINSPVVPLLFANNATITGAGPNNYFIGYLGKTGNQAFTFPVGSATSYMPISMTAPALSTDQYYVSFNTTVPPNSTNFDATLKSLMPGYWDFKRSAGTSNVQLTLNWSYNAPKPIFPDVAHVAQMVGSQWQDKGSNNLSYTYLQGSVSSNLVTNPAGYFTLGFTSANPGSCSSCDPSVNWTTVRMFDEYGRVIDDQKLFSDNMGRKKQLQSRNLVENKIIAISNVYDTYGKLGITTLPAPIGNASDFTYTPNFITNGSGNAYSHRDFDSIGVAINTVDNPYSVSSNSPLGNYYSNNNLYEAYVATSGLPFRGGEYNQRIIGGVTRASGPSDSLSMGKGHEVRSVTLPVYDELNHYYTIKNNYFLSSAGTSLNGEVLKKINKDENGTEHISFINKAGNILATCQSSTTDSLQINITLGAKYSSYILTPPANTTYDNIIIQSIGNINVYDNSSMTNWYGTPSNNPYTSLVTGQTIIISSNTPFYISYNSNTTTAVVYPHGTIYNVAFAKNKVKSSESLYTSYNSTDIHLQKGHHLSITQGHVAGIINNTVSHIDVINLENGTLVYRGTVASFTTASTLAPGFYRIIYTNQESNINSDYYAYVTISYYNKYGNYSYMYYDNAGRLVAQTMPNGVLKTNTSKPKYTTYYIHNTLGWKLSSIDPDKGHTYYVYEKDGRLRFYQDSVQRIGGRFSYINYDTFKRTIETGEYTSGAANGNPTALYFQDMLGYYKNTSIPTGYINIFTVLENIDGIDDPRCNTVSKSFYDLPDAGLANAISGYIQRNVNGKQSCSSNSNSIYWYSYDEIGRVEWTVQQLNGGSAGTAGGDFSSLAASRVKTIEYVYDFNHNLMQSIYQKNILIERLDHFYSYDIMQRLSKVQTSLQGGPLVEQAQYYYYLHGPMKRKELGDTLQGMDYVYTADGLLKGINHPYLDTGDPGNDGYAGAHSHFGKDVFGMTLEYYDNDYVRDTKYQTTANLTASGHKGYFNGTVRSLTWNQSAISSGGLAQYAYTYDSKYQLTGADFGAHDNSNNLFAISSNAQYKEYGIQYDLNGNLVTLRRNDNTGAISMNDYINYLYGNNNNTLSRTMVTVNLPPTRLYAYDGIGRLTSCSTEVGVHYLYYDYTGKVTGVYKDAAKTQPLATFLYDERGYRIRKTQYNASAPYNAVNHVYYINDSEGRLMSVYNVNIATNTVSQNEIYIYGKDRIGKVSQYGSPEYHYDIRDHLGNVRAVIRKNSMTLSIEVISYSDYYPQGGLMPGRNFVSGVNDRNNCYQGEYAERDDETGYVNFELRMYDPVIGRWFVPDPKDQFYSPYVAMGNNFISGIDPSGGEFTWLNALEVVGFVALTIATEGEDLPILYEIAIDASVGATLAAASSIAEGNKIGSQQFWADVEIGAISGAVAGATDGILDEFGGELDADAIAAAKGVTKVEKLAARGAISGATSGFATGVGNGVKNGLTLKQDIEAGITGALIGAVIGGAAGSIEGALSSNEIEEVSEEEVSEKTFGERINAALRAAPKESNRSKWDKVMAGVRSQGELDIVSSAKAYIKLTSKYFYENNALGVGSSIIMETYTDHFFGDSLGKQLNVQWWGIEEKEEEEEEEPKEETNSNR